MSGMRLLRTLGLDPRVTLQAPKAYLTYWRNQRSFLREAEQSQHEFLIGKPFPCLRDRDEAAGTASGHYFHQDLLVAQKIWKADPHRHVDVGSRVDSFVAHVATFRPIEVLDIRPIEASITNITFRQRDILQDDPSMDGSTDSLSCLHALEHVGLGRYGDPIDYYGYLKGWKNLVKMLRPGGRFYFSVPVSAHQRVEFDAHRIFSLPYLLNELISPSFDVEDFAFVDDLGDLHTNIDTTGDAAIRTFDLHHGCGIFSLIKRASGL